jgi:hypothetical protein
VVFCMQGRGERSGALIGHSPAVQFEAVDGGPDRVGLPGANAVATASRIHDGSGCWKIVGR